MDWDVTAAMDALGDRGAATAAGVIVGAMFGVSAQRSRFCLRAATAEFGRGEIGERTAVWLLCFSTALFWTQLFDLLGGADLAASRTLAATGSVSGALIGGLLFGVGMTLARGCSGRLLVLAASGNLRSLVTGLVFVVTAQMAFHGALAPLRETLAVLWTTGPANVDLAQAAGLDRGAGVALGVGFAAAALWSARRAGVSARILIYGSGVGFAVGAGWLITSLLAARAFEPTPIESIAFSGPSADTLMALLSRAQPVDYGVGLIGGVFAGAFFSALLAGEARFEGFDGAPAMRRHIAGGALMGFGAMLAGGCAIGAGVSGAATLALTAWVALCAMWAGALATGRLLDHPAAAPSAA